jgi:putative inorganic carbon (HCO3(-)) transporter
MPSPTILGVIVGSALCVVSIGSLLEANRRKGELCSLLRHPPLFLLAWILISPVVVLWAGSDAILIGIGIAGGVVSSLVHPVFAVPFLLSNLLLRPWEIFPDGNQLSVLPRALAALCLFSWLLEKIRTYDFTFVLDRFMVAFISLLVWLILSASMTFNSGDSLPYIMAAIVPAAVVTFVTRNVLVTRWSIRYSTGVLAITCTAIAVCAMWVTSSTGPLFGTKMRLHSFGQWGNSNDLAALFVASIPFAVARARAAKIGALLSCFGWYALVVTMCISLLLTQSRGGVVALFTAFLLGLFLSGRNPKVLVLSITASILVGFGAMMAFNRDAGDMEGSSDSRLNYAVVGLKMVKSNPLLGVGPGNYPLLYESFSTVFEEFGQRTAHSSWVLILSETGVPGFLLFTSLFVLGAMSAWRAKAVFPEVLVAYTAYFIAVSILSQSYALLTYFFMVLPVGMLQGIRSVGFHGFEDSRGIKDTPAVTERSRSEQLPKEPVSPRPSIKSFTT